MPPGVLIGASLTFYASWGTTFLSILFLSMTFNYLARLVMLAIGARDASGRKWTLFAIVSGNLAALFTFKYFNLFAGAFADLLGKAYQPLHLAIPLGISFYTVSRDHSRGRCLQRCTAHRLGQICRPLHLMSAFLALKGADFQSIDRMRRSQL